MPWQAFSYLEELEVPQSFGDVGLPRDMAMAKPPIMQDEIGLIELCDARTWCGTKRQLSWCRIRSLSPASRSS
jgi:hypothetical protein